jgi:hypothetical protein
MEYKCVYGQKEVQAKRIPFSSKEELLPSNQKGIREDKIQIHETKQDPTLHL